MKGKGEPMFPFMPPVPLPAIRLARLWVDLAVVMVDGAWALAGQPRRVREHRWKHPPPAKDTGRQETT
jgi:hypothetical protein